MRSLLSRVQLKDEKGFSLVELMIVIAIMAVLAAFAVPKMIGVIGTAKRGGDKAALHTLQVAVEQYYAEHGQYPSSNKSAAEIKDALEPYLRKTWSWVNSKDQSFIYVGTPKGTSYVLVDPQGQTGDSTELSCITDDNGTYRGRVAWTQGSSATLTVERWEDGRMNKCTVLNENIYLLAYDR